MGHTKCEWPACPRDALYATYATQPWGDERVWRNLCDYHEKQAIKLRKAGEKEKGETWSVEP